MEHKRFKTVRRLAAPLLIIVLVIFAASNIQAITDYARLYNYQPPAEIASLADKTAMTDRARKLFYINHPEIASRSTFNERCNKRGEKTIVLGCYHSVDRGIYLFDVTDPRLAGVEEVTAAHEMLHSAYDRLSNKDREYINAQLQDYYASKVTDVRIRDTIAAYEHSEPNDIANEMHSIFATEIAVLTPQLEEHYKLYFSDRSKVVQFASVYQKEFTSRQEQVKAYDTRLADLKQQIEDNTALLKNREAEIVAMQRQLERDRSSGNVEAYNAGVPIYNARVDQYNELIRATQGDIAEYNQAVAERNELALEVRELTQSISSQLVPIGQE